METEFSRTQMLLGQPAMNTLKGAHIAIFGVGGVGGYVVEVLARSGIGALDLFDNDVVSISNINRQLCALHSTIGRLKVDVAAERVNDINPMCIVNRHPMFYMPDNADSIDLSKFDYVADCIDTVTAKLELIKRCHTLNVPIICSMGAANKLDPTAFHVADITKTTMDPLAKVIRKKLRDLHIRHLKVVFSEEKPLKPMMEDVLLEDSKSNDANNKASSPTPHRIVPASNAFVPASAGLVLGGEIIKNLLRQAGTMRSIT